MAATPATTALAAADSQSETPVTTSDTMVEAGGAMDPLSSAVSRVSRPAVRARTRSAVAGTKATTTSDDDGDPEAGGGERHQPGGRQGSAAAGPEAVRERIERGRDGRGEDDRRDDRAQERGRPEDDEAERDDHEQAPAEAGRLGQPVGDERSGIGFDDGCGQVGALDGDCGNLPDPHRMRHPRPVRRAVEQPGAQLGVPPASAGSASSRISSPGAASRSRSSARDSV